MHYLEPASKQSNIHYFIRMHNDKINLLAAFIYNHTTCSDKYTALSSVYDSKIKYTNILLHQ